MKNITAIIDGEEFEIVHNEDSICKKNSKRGGSVMLFPDENDIPPPPPRYKTKVAKDKSIKDEKQWLIQRYDTFYKRWVNDSTYTTLTALRVRLRNYRYYDKRMGMTLKYRTVRITIKKEVIE